MTEFTTEATPWDGKGGRGGRHIRGWGGEANTNYLALVLIRVCTLELAWVVEGGDPDRVCKIPSFNYECAFM